MTSFAPPSVLKHPQCGGYILRQRLRSFNDFGAMGWSDGYTSIWGLNAISQLGNCPWCGTLFWLDDAETVGVLPRQPVRMNWFGRLLRRISGDKRGELAREQNWKETPEEWKSAKRMQPPSTGDFWAALENTAPLPQEREIYVRRQLWWEGNHPFRFGLDGKPLPGQPELGAEQIQQNMAVLYALCAATKQPDPVLVGELLRELSRFDEAVAMLESVADDDNNRASKIAEFARQKDPMVREIWRSQYD